MRNLFPVIFSVITIVIFGGVQLLFFRFLNREWWQKKWLRRASWALPLTGIISVGVWGWGEYTANDMLIYPGAVAAVGAFVFEACLILSLPFSGILHFLNRIIDWLSRRRVRHDRSRVDPGRRAFLKGGAAAIPLATLAAGGSGMVIGMASPRVYQKSVYIDDLPPDLDGLKILHLSDIHIHHYVTVDDLTEVLERARPFQPDLVAVTGDVSDDISALGDALSLVDQLKAPLGAYACLGNHEYLRGIGRVRQIFDRSPVPLLVNGGLRLMVGRTSIFLGGVDDPRHMRFVDHGFYRDGIAATLSERNDDDYVVLLSHRPDALDSAAAEKVDLTLAGHTHGTQLGLNDRSLFESVWPERYLWGYYRKESSHLYTTSGVGHWFPFRLGCPCEAPVIELRRGKRGSET